MYIILIHRWWAFKILFKIASRTTMTAKDCPDIIKINEYPWSSSEDPHLVAVVEIPAEMLTVGSRGRLTSRLKSLMKISPLQRKLVWIWSSQTTITILKKKKKIKNLNQLRKRSRRLLMSSSALWSELTHISRSKSKSGRKISGTNFSIFMRVSRHCHRFLAWLDHVSYAF